MNKVEKKIALRGQVYAAPKTESVEIKNQGVLCGSGGGGGLKSSGGFKAGLGNGYLN